MQNMMLAYSSKCYSVTGVDKVTIFSSHIRNMKIVDSPNYLVSMAVFVLHYLCIGRALKRGQD